MLDLAFRHGISPAEIAVLSGIDPDTVIDLRDEALLRLAADIGLAGEDEAAKVRAMLSGWRGPGQNGTVPRAKRPHLRWLLSVALGGAGALAIVLPLTLTGGHRATSALHNAAVSPVASLAPVPPRAQTAPPPPAPPPRPTVALHRAPGSPKTAHATARLATVGQRLTLSVGGLPRWGRGSYVVLLYNSPHDSVQIGRFPGGSASLRLALPGNYRRFGSLRVMRNRWWRSHRPRRSVLIAPIKALG